MTVQLPAPYIASGRFSDIDAVNVAAPGWQLDFRQLDGGSLCADLHLTESKTVQLAHARFDRRMDQRGCTPGGRRTFAILEERITPLLWYGQTATHEALLAFPSDGDIDVISAADFEVFTLSVPEHLLTGISQSIGLQDPTQFLGRSATRLTCDPPALRALRSRLHRFCQMVSHSHLRVPRAVLLAELEYEIPRQLLFALAHGRATPCPATASARNRALKRAVDFIRGHADRPPSVREVCQHAQVSERLLNYAFKDRFGMPPKRYIQGFRLDCVRGELRHATPSTAMVTDVANRWGFWHMGQFAADYRRQFGELPSETLKRRVGHRARWDGPR